MMNYALINNNLVENVADADQAWADMVAPDWQYVINVTDIVPQPGIGWSYNGSTFTAPVDPPAPVVNTWIITRNAFQNRFPITANGVSTKYDLMTLFLTDTGYAASLGVTGDALYSQRSLIITGNNRLNVVSDVDLQNQSAIDYVNMMTNVEFPEVFRLTTAEATTILTTPAAPNETP
jgi:hypothetical protein